MRSSNGISFYVRASIILLGIIALFFILFVGQPIIVPLIFSFIIAILLNPVVNFLTSKKINLIISILITLLLAFLLLAGFLYFISSQIIGFSEMMPQLKEKTNTLINDGLQWASQAFNMSEEKIKQSVSNLMKEASAAAKSLIGPALLTFGGVIALLLLIPVYIFLILLYKESLLVFISRLFKSEKQKTVSEILTESKLLIQNYLVGLILETGIVAVLNTIGLLIIGIPYAVLLGVLSALLNIIPYIGGLIAVGLVLLVALAAGSPGSALWALIILLIVQFLDNNIIVPKVVASKVKINELVSIVAIIVGGALWGIPGMFLSLPLIAILKVIFDRIEPLKPVGFLLGDLTSTRK